MEEKLVINSISEYYNSLVEKYGYDSKSCDYGNSNSQFVKFKVLSEAFDYSNKRVLDIGCGFADFYNFLSLNFDNFDYYGVDISSKMIETAKLRHPKIEIELRNVFENPIEEKFDIVTSNGIFYLLGNDSKNLMQNFISKMFDMTEEIVAFNSLSTWAEDQLEGEFYADPLETLDFCKTLTKWVTLRHDYHHRDFTIYMYKNRNI